MESRRLATPCSKVYESKLRLERIALIQNAVIGLNAALEIYDNQGTLNAAYAAINAISLISACQETQMRLFAALVQIDRSRSVTICRFLRS